MRNTLKREFYIPKDAVQMNLGEDHDAAVYEYMIDGNPCAIAFHGKAQKPDWHYQFVNIEQRDRRIKDLVDGRRAHAERKAKRAAEQKKPHGLKVGDILVSSWGYDQTNVNWYEVVGVKGASINIQPVSSTVTESGEGYDHVAPVPGETYGRVRTKRPTRVGDIVTVKISSFAYAYLWEGNSKHETATGWGH
jgi:hypothetical protein